MFHGPMEMSIGSWWSKAFHVDDGQRGPEAREERERELLRGDGLEAAGETETFCQPAYNSHTVGSTDAEAITTGQQMCWPCGCRRRGPCQLATSHVRQGAREEKETSRASGGRHCDCRATSPVQGATGGVSSRRRCTRASQAALDGDITVDLERTCSSPQCQLATTPRLLHLLRESGHAWDSCG